MRAAVVTDFHAPLVIQDIATPEPGPDEVLVHIETSGLCHTDIHASRGDWPVKPTPPFVPGHEGIGHIERIGSSVTTRKVGDRVAIAWLGTPWEAAATADAAGSAVRASRTRVHPSRRLRRVRRRPGFSPCCCLHVCVYFCDEFLLAWPGSSSGSGFLTQGGDLVKIIL